MYVTFKGADVGLVKMWPESHPLPQWGDEVVLIPGKDPYVVDRVTWNIEETRIGVVIEVRAATSEVFRVVDSPPEDGPWPSSSDNSRHVGQGTTGVYEVGTGICPIPAGSGA